MNDNQAQSTGFWTSLNKVQKLVTLIVGLGTIVGLLIPIIPAFSGYKIDARGYCSPVYLPEDLYKGVPDPVKGHLKNLDSIWLITVENQGKKQVHDLVLELPFDGLYEVRQIGATTVFTEFQRIISLNSLRPSNKLQVILWANSPYYPTTTWCQNGMYNETQITHPDGVVNIKYEERVTGLLAWGVRTNRNWRGLLGFFMIALVLVAGLLIPGLAKSTSHQTQPDTTSDLVIESAKYGAKGNYRDVTSILQSMVKDGKLELVVSNDSLLDGDDPISGTPKKLHVKYTCAGESHTVTVAEWETLSLP